MLLQFPVKSVQYRFEKEQKSVEGKRMYGTTMMNDKHHTYRCKTSCKVTDNIIIEILCLEELGFEEIVPVPIEYIDHSLPREQCMDVLTTPADLHSLI